MKKITLVVLMFTLLSGCTPGVDYSAEKEHLRDLAFGALNQKYSVNMEEWGLDEPNFAIKDTKNQIKSFGPIANDDVVYIYGTIPNHTDYLGGEDFPYYAIYSSWQGEVIECEILWSE